jgi:hypothetical protein
MSSFISNPQIRTGRDFTFEQLVAVPRNSIKFPIRPVSDGVLLIIDELGTAEERRMNQLSTAEFGAAKVRHKFG